MMKKSEVTAWCILCVASAVIGVVSMFYAYPLGIFMATVIFTISLVIVFTGIDQEVRKDHE